MEKIYSEYVVLHEFGSLPLSVKVNEFIKEGWQPIGGVSVAHVIFPEVGGDNVWAQAMGR